MKTNQDILLNDFFGRKLYILFSAIISIPVFMAVHSYVESIHVSEDDAIATGATIFFIGGIFSGRYIIQIWSSKLTALPVGVLAGLSLGIAVCTGWLFFHADFPLQGRDSINLLLFWLPFVVISPGLGMLIKITHDVSQNQLRAARLSAAHSKSELHLLQSQLSPHFLFNTLNNLYGLSITEHEKIPPLLLKLSELLRYSVYEANELFVPLKDELAYIDNYIEFEKIRVGDRLVLKLEIEQSAEEIKIAPMLLIVFIENAFKHSKNTADERIYIDITLKIWGNSILFSVKNSQDKEKTNRVNFEKSNGFGLANVTKRLELLYPHEHELNVQNEEDFYMIMLRLKMK